MKRDERKRAIRQPVLEELGWDCRKMKEGEFWTTWVSLLVWLNSCMSFRQMEQFTGLSSTILIKDMERAKVRLVRNRAILGRKTIPVFYKEKWYHGGINELKEKYGLPYYVIHRGLKRGWDLEKKAAKYRERKKFREEHEKEKVV